MIEYLEFRNERLPVRIKMSVLQKYEEETGESWDATQKRIKDDPPKSITEVLKMYEPILFYGLASGARALNRSKVMVPWFDDEGNPVSVELKRENKEILYDILDDCMQDLMNMFPKFFPTEKEVNEAKKPMPGNRNQRRQAARQEKKNQ